jgi:hypothetical protein
VRSCPLKDEEMAEFSKLPNSWKIILEPMIGNVVIQGPAEKPDDF